MSAPFLGPIQRFVATVPPWYVRGKNIGTLLESAALARDNNLETLIQGLRLSQPLRCDESALEQLSRDRGIRIYPTEPVASKRYRLSRWWQLRRQFGTLQGQMRNLQPYFLPAVPTIRMVHQDGAGGRATWHTLDGDGVYTITKTEPSNWDWDGRTSRWSRYWCIIYRDDAMGYDAPAEYDDGTEWDGGALWDGGPSTAQIADIVGALREAKAAHSRLAGVFMTTEGFDPEATATTDAEGWTSLPVGNWRYAADPITGLPTRPPYASLIYKDF